jgi:Leucine-rich repeat (LRR) protein
MRCLTHLSLDGCGITRIGGFVFPKRAFHLDLSYNVIDLNKLQNMDKIIALSLNHCVMRHLSRWVVPATLEELDLSGTGIPDIRQLPPLPRGLRKLDLSGNELKNMDGWVPNLWLGVLDIGSNRFSDFPVIKANPHLTKLVLDGNDISDGDLYRLYTMVTYNADGSHVFKIVATPTDIGVGGCRLSKTSMVIYDAAAELVARNEGPKELDEYLHAITCLTVLRCAASIPHDVPVHTFPLDLCKHLKKYIFKE